MRLANLDLVQLGTMENGFTLILVLESDLARLDRFMYKKSNEMFVYLQEVDGDNPRLNYSKLLINRQDEILEVVDKIVAHVSLVQEERNIQQEHVQLFDGKTRSKIRWGEKYLADDLIDEEYCIYFEVLPFKVQELADNIVVKFTYVFPDNTLGETYTEMTLPDNSIWAFLRQMRDKHFLQMEDEVVIAGQYQWYMVDRTGTSIVRLVKNKEAIKDVVSDTKQKGL